MSREILFKAKRKDWRELPKEEWWVEGDLFDLQPGQYMIRDRKQYGRASTFPVWEFFKYCSYEIAPETLCQYTGLTDKNGKRIWENDICIIHSSNIDDEDGYFTIAWDEDGARFILDGNLIVDFDNCYGYECEVIGNIFDNPELLKED